MVQAMLHIRLERRDAEAGGMLHRGPHRAHGLSVGHARGAHVIAEKGAPRARAGRVSEGV